MAASQTALFSRKQSGGLYVVADKEAHPGVVRFVDSTHAAASNGLGGGQSPDTPFATLAYVFANAATLTPALAAGDVILVAPGHTETIAAAAGIACATAGVKVIGLGWGAARPTFTWSATDSSWTITAASVYIKNIRCLVSIDEVVSLFSVTGAHCTLDAVDFYETASAQAIQFLLTTNAADWLTVKNCYHQQLTAPAANSLWISLVGCEGARILDNFFRLTFTNSASSITISGGTDPPYCEIARNTIVQLGGTTQAAAIKLTTGTGAFVHDNRVACGSTALPGIVAVGSAGYGAENYALNTAAVSGLLDPVADS